MDLKIIDNEITWQNFLNSYSPDALFQDYLWGEVIKIQHKKVYRFGLYKNNKLVGIAQTALIKSKKGKFLQVRHGPILTKFDNSIYKLFIDKIKDYFKSENILFIRINPLVDGKYESSFKKIGFSPSPLHAMDGEYCWILPLKDPDSLLKNMRKSTRYEINKAIKLGIEVKKTISNEYINSFKKLYESTAERHGFVKHTGIMEELNIFSNKNRAFLYTAIYKNEVIASTIILYMKNQAIYHHSASLKTNLPATHLIQWTAIKDAYEKGLKNYNFWGISPDENKNHPWYGLTIFKKGFGGDAKEFIHSQDLIISKLYIFYKIYEYLRAYIKGYK